MIERLNSDLANTLGNLVNRTISMSNKYFGGVVENRNVQLTENDAAVDADLKQTVTGTYAKVVAKMEELRVADALTEIFGIPVRALYARNRREDRKTAEYLPA